MTLLLHTSQLEYLLKGLLQQLLEDKDVAWTDGKAAAADRMTELSEYFTGEKALSRVRSTAPRPHRAPSPYMLVLFHR